MRRVSNIMGEITASAQAQSQSVSQVSLAMGELDGMTQQNAALVEESSAAATSLREHAARLTHAVGQFRLTGDQDGGGHGGANPPPTPLPAAHAAPRRPAALRRPAASRLPLTH